MYTKQDSVSIFLFRQKASVSGGKMSGSGLARYWYFGSGGMGQEIIKKAV